MRRTIVIEYGDKTYYGHIAVIQSTGLGWARANVFTANLVCEWESSGISVAGQYRLDAPLHSLPDGSEVKASRGPGDCVGSALGMDYIMTIMDTVGVPEWEDLEGSSVLVLFESNNSIGTQAVGIAGVHNDRVLIFQNFMDMWTRDEKRGS